MPNEGLLMRRSGADLTDLASSSGADLADLAASDHAGPGAHGHHD